MNQIEISFNYDLNDLHLLYSHKSFNPICIQSFVQCPVQILMLFIDN